MEGNRDHRGRSMPRSHSPTLKNTTENEYIWIHGISKRKKQLDDIPEIWGYEICI